MINLAMVPAEKPSGDKPPGSNLGYPARCTPKVTRLSIERLLTKPRPTQAPSGRSSSQVNNPYTHIEKLNQASESLKGIRAQEARWMIRPIT